MKTEEEKEKARMYAREYRKANRNKIKAQRRNNREHRAVVSKAYRDSFKDGLFTVYLLPKENYVGQTDCYHLRMKNQKSLGRDITDAKVLGSYKTREEALAVEASYHAKGYKGFNNGI